MYNRDNQNFYVSDEMSSQFVQKTFMWMAAALMVTLATVIGVMTSPMLQMIVFKYGMIIMIAEIGAVFFLSGMINKIKLQTAKMVFFGYAIANGLTLSYLRYTYSPQAILIALVLTVIIFTVMSAYGYFTKEDLSSYGGLLKGGLIVLIVVGIINIFMASSLLYWAGTFLGVLVFIALIGYDVNRIKKISFQLSDQTGETVEKIAIIGALSLYLDAINLFLYLLRLFGGGRSRR